MKKVFVILFGCFLFSAVSADDLYQVDLIVFSAANPTAIQSENWTNALRTPVITNATELVQPLVATNDATPPELQNNQLLPSDKIGLQNEFTKLQSNANYKILLHISWQQPIADIKSTKWVHVFAGQAYDPSGQAIDTIIDDQNTAPDTTADTTTPNTTAVTTTPGTDTTVTTDTNTTPADNTPTPFSIPIMSQYPNARFWELNGKVRVSRTPYLTINTKLYLTLPESVLGSGSDQGSIGNFQPIPLITFTINENRRTKYNELNYFDHPVFGALVKITKVQTPSS